jgi:hypothetical protein
LGSKRICIALITIALAAVAATAKPDNALASRGMLVGIFDPVQPLIAPEKTFDTLVSLHVKVIRVSLDWGATVARKKPAIPRNPADPAYNWDNYDRVVLNAKKHKIQVLLGIYGTPRWAQTGKKSLNRAPAKARYLRDFAFAAAKRYSGKFKRSDGTVLPAVRKWLAWNEPNNPYFLRPQWLKVGKRKYIPVAARTYAWMCTAVWAGVHSTHLKGETVACGTTDSYGNDTPRSRRPSISPTRFLREVKGYGLRHFDAWAHHPYYRRPSQSPTSAPGRNTVTLANIGVLTKLVGKLYGKKPVWITEYGYQTRPPDPLFGVSWVKQAKYLKQAYAIARRNPRITMMLWFLLRDESRLSGWQSGLITARGKRKPAYYAFRRMPH